MKNSEFVNKWGGRLERLNEAFVAEDEAAFNSALQEMAATSQAMPPMLADIMKLSESLHGALERFRADSRLAALAHKDIPDARLRLEHVLSMTEEAANRTLDLIEKSAPLASATVRSANELMETLDDRSHNEIRTFLDETRGNFEAVRANLSEVMLAQSFQDLTGQILRGVQRLIGEVESSLGDLARVTGIRPAPAPDPRGLEGPAVPGVTRNAVSGQDDVDELIAGLGI